MSDTWSRCAARATTSGMISAVHLYHRAGEKCLFPLRHCGQGTDMLEYSFLQEAIRNDGKINSIKLREAVISNG